MPEITGLDLLSFMQQDATLCSMPVIRECAGSRAPVSGSVEPRVLHGGMPLRHEMLGWWSAFAPPAVTPTRVHPLTLTQ